MVRTLRLGLGVGCGLSGAVSRSFLASVVRPPPIHGFALFAVRLPTWLFVYTMYPITNVSRLFDQNATYRAHDE